MFKENEMFIRCVIACVLCLFALKEDMKDYRIPNGLIGMGIIVQGIFLIIDFIIGVPCARYLYGGICTFAIMVILYMVGAVGAGDVKLMGVIGLMVGLQAGLTVAIGALVVGAIVGIAGMCRHVCGTTKLAILGKSSTLKLHKFHYTIGIAMAQILVTCTYIGGWKYA